MFQTEKDQAITEAVLAHMTTLWESANKQPFKTWKVQPLRDAVAEGYDAGYRAAKEDSLKIAEGWKSSVVAGEIAAEIRKLEPKG